MKTTLKFTLVAAAAFLFAGMGQVNAQQKFGYLNTQELISAMPEMDSVRTKMTALGTELEAQYTVMQTELINKTNDYKNSLSTMSDAVRKQKEQDLDILSQRLQEFQQSAQEESEQKQREYLQPVLKKAQDAVNKVGKEQGFICVFDIATGALAYHNPDTMVDALPLVKRALGITK